MTVVLERAVVEVDERHELVRGATDDGHHQGRPTTPRTTDPAYRPRRPTPAAPRGAGKTPTDSSGGTGPPSQETGPRRAAG